MKRKSVLDWGVVWTRYPYKQDVQPRKRSRRKEMRNLLVIVKEKVAGRTHIRTKKFPGKSFFALRLVMAWPIILYALRL